MILTLCSGISTQGLLPSCFILPSLPRSPFSVDPTSTFSSHCRLLPCLAPSWPEPPSSHLCRTPPIQSAGISDPPLTPPPPRALSYRPLFPRPLSIIVFGIASAMEMVTRFLNPLAFSRCTLSSPPRPCPTLDLLRSPDMLSLYLLV